MDLIIFFLSFFFMKSMEQHEFGFITMGESSTDRRVVKHDEWGWYFGRKGAQCGGGLGSVSR